jgi:hypothetical protein
MSAHYLFRNKLAVTAHTVLPRAAIEIVIPRPRYKYFLPSSNITRPHINTLLTGDALDFDLIILYASMLLLAILLTWLIALTVLRVYWYIYDKYHERRCKPSRTERFGAWRDSWNEGNDQWVRRSKSRAERKIEHSKSKVEPQNVGKWNRWLDKEAQQDTSAAQNAIDKVGERMGLLSKQRDGAGESEASGNSVVHLVVHQKDCVGECWFGSRKRSAVIEKEIV